MSSIPTIRAWSRRHVPNLVVSTIVLAPIALVNLSLDYDATSAEIQRAGLQNLELAYGWPLGWYWRIAKLDPGKSSFELLFSRFSAARLAANVAMWLLILATSVVACGWLVRHCRPHSLGRPRILTIIVLIAVAAPIVLSNLSAGDFDLSAAGNLQCSCGWPLTWYWHILLGMDGPVTFVLSPRSPVRLAGNLAMWLVMLAAPGVTCEWLLRRIRPRLRWSLRTMLAMVALAAIFIAWCTSVRDRANVQDELIANVGAEGTAVIETEVWGPKWLNFLVADRYLRRINYARVYDGGPRGDLLKRLGHLPDLRFLELWVEEWHPDIAATLGDMRHVRKLRILLRKQNGYLRDYDEDRIPHEWLAAIGKLKGLEKLDLEWSVIADDSLPYLADLMNLKTLYWTDHVRWMELVDFDSRRSLSRLSALPQLETIDFTGALVGDQDLRQLAVLPRLKSLNLSETFVTDAGLAELASVASLEELAIDQGIVSAAGLESLLALKRLKALHIIDDSLHAVHWREMERLRASRTGFRSIRWQTDLRGPLTLDDGYEMFVPESEIDRCRRALEQLRLSNPAIVIDSDGDAFNRRKRF